MPPQGQQDDAPYPFCVGEWQTPGWSSCTFLELLAFCFILLLHRFYRSRPKPTPQPQPSPVKPISTSLKLPQSNPSAASPLFFVKATCCRPRSQLHAVCVPRLACSLCRNFNYILPCVCLDSLAAGARILVFFSETGTEVFARNQLSFISQVHVEKYAVSSSMPRVLRQ